MKTTKGIAKRGRLSEKSYFSIFGKLKVKRYLYHLAEESFAPLDMVLNLPVRCYSYFLSEWVNHLNIKDAYGETVILLKKFLGLVLSVSGVETITQDSAAEYEAYYELKNILPKMTQEQEHEHEHEEHEEHEEQEHEEQEHEEQEEQEQEQEQKGELTVIGFDGKGVPMIKKEAAKIKGRQGKGEKRQKKKEALVGVKYTLEPEPRTAEEVAGNLVYPEKKKHGMRQRKRPELSRSAILPVSKNRNERSCGKFHRSLRSSHSRSRP